MPELRLGASPPLQSVLGNNSIPQLTTAQRPAWNASLIGAVYYDLTLKKLVIAGAAAWEVVTSV